MRTRRGMVVAAVLAVLVAAVGEAEAIDGRAWKALGADQRAYYVVGVIDTWQNLKASVEYVRERRPGTAISPAEGIFLNLTTCIRERDMSYRQVIDEVQKYMDAPETDASNGMASLVWNAISAVCKSR